MIKEISDRDYEQLVSQGKVIVDFWAPWCGPCSMLGPVIEEVAKELQNVTIVKINVDDYPELAGKHGVLSIPTLLYYLDGKLADTSVGVVSKSMILTKLDRLV